MMMSVNLVTDLPTVTSKNEKEETQAAKSYRIMKAVVSREKLFIETNPPPPKRETKQRVDDFMVDKSIQE